MRENEVFLVPVKYTIVCRAPALALLGRTHTIVCFDFVIAVSKLEQPSCLIAWAYLGKKLYLDECPSSW